MLGRISGDDGRLSSMFRVVIVGDRDSGKTTFLGLLYAAQVRSGSDKADDFRFHADLESMEAITLLFQLLMSGSFPDPVTKQEINKIGFQIGHRRTGLGFLRARKWAPEAFATVRFALLRTLDQDISRLRMGSAVGGGKLNDILDSDAVTIVVDSTKLVVKGERPEIGPMSRYDGVVEELLTLLRRMRDPSGRLLLHPIFLFSKFDRVSPKVLRSVNVAAEPPRVEKIGARVAYAEAILAHNLPKTLARVQARERGGLRFAKPAYFFSRVRTDEAAPGQPERIRLRRDELAGWEPDYSRDEYLAFLVYLEDIVRSGE